MRYTKGPWKFSTAPQPNGCPIVGARGLMVAMLAHSVNEPGQKEIAIANAALVEAAPEMFEILERLCRLLGGSSLYFEQVTPDAEALLHRVKSRMTV